MKRSFVLLWVTCCLSSSFVFAQSDIPKGWHLLDPVKDSYYGISLNKAYQFLQQNGKKSKPVIVAVLDSGVDTAHEDLKGILWHNPKEIPGNGIDDDGNGYTDDVYGWNFLGNKDGRNLQKAGDERSRVYHQCKEKYLNKIIDTAHLSKEELYQYKIWQSASNDLNLSNDNQMEIMLLEVTAKALKRHNEVICKEMGCNEYDCEKLESFDPKTKEGKEAKFGYLTCMKLIGIDPEEKNTTTISQLDEYIDGKKESLEAKDVVPPNYRAKIIKDNYNNINDKFYGNPDVMGPNPMHGTHVTGIIAAQRNNGIGMDGVADNVKVMMVRVVPDGDEYDKDVALGIIYAVDNGAKVINMSFGKPYSPQKQWVDSAIHYAEMKDVLIVHAAGNESVDVDQKQNYPNPDYLFTNTKAGNFITVGASSDPKMGKGLAADFSNYGKEEVDVFSPGIKIYSTLPGKHEYGNLRGTSMAAPIVTGLAALIRSYFPELDAEQVKQVIEKSVTVPDSSVIAFKPGTKDEVPFGSLSKSGGVINAYGAVVTAENMEKNLRKKNERLPKSTFKTIKTN